MIDAITLCPRASNLIAHDFGDDRTAWLAARRKGLGGSDIAPILGLSPWTSPLQTWRRKTDVGVTCCVVSTGVVWDDGTNMEDEE